MGLTTIREVAEWCEDVREDLGDPSRAVCQLFFRWVTDPRAYRRDDLVCGLENGIVFLRIGPFAIVPVPIVCGEPLVDPAGDVVSFGATLISFGLWKVEPSLNIPGLIHAFVALHGVESPAPWERRIILVSA
jgi:hypothetical protein